MLPNESLLDVLRCADYATLVYAKLAGSRLQHVGTQFAAQLARLACRRRFRVRFYFGSINCCEWSGIAGHSTSNWNAWYREGDQHSLATACRKLAEAIGPHAVELLEFPKGSWNEAGIGVIFKAAPVLKYAVEVQVRAIADCHRTRYTGAKDLHAHSDAFMRNFAGLKTLRLSLDYDLLSQFDWTFLGQESARDLRLIKVCDTTSTWRERAERCAEGLVRHCLTVPRTLDGEPLVIDFSEESFRAAFARQIIELLKGSGRKLTFRMRTPRDERLVLDESDYTRDVVDDDTTRYVSKGGGIVVDKGRWYPTLTIQSTDDVHRRTPTIE
ncbi:hypothetical protein AAVH_26260 [Aphelenchoides avenae]|nr:hypothetical protein AAVH_26260 [Aphelenchus avenae]